MLIRQNKHQTVIELKRHSVIFQGCILLFISATLMACGGSTSDTTIETPTTVTPTTETPTTETPTTVTPTTETPTTVTPTTVTPTTETPTTVSPTTVSPTTETPTTETPTTETPTTVTPTTETPTTVTPTTETPTTVTPTTETPTTVTPTTETPTTETPTTETPTTETPTSTLPINNTTANSQGDFTNKKLTNRDPDCAAYVGSYSSAIFDVQQNTTYNSTLVVTSNTTSCTMTSNNIPNHDVGANTTTGNSFASKVAPNTLNYVMNIPRNPVRKNTATYVRKQGGNITLNGIMLNGVDLDMDSAFCYNTEFRTPLQIGLGTRVQCGLFADWYAVPAANPDYVTLDEFTGHPFDGRYHYHGDNISLSNLEEGRP